MTESEAIEKFKRTSILWESDTNTEMVEAVKMSIQALEKQIPKKVQLRHIRKFDGFDDGECPTCGQSVSRDCDGTDNFCPDCGQKLDWRDEE